jgi:hypothetical protein
MYVTVPMTYETICHEYSINLVMFLKQNWESKFSWQPCPLTLWSLFRTYTVSIIFTVHSWYSHVVWCWVTQRAVGSVINEAWRNCVLVSLYLKLLYWLSVSGGFRHVLLKWWSFVWLHRVTRVGSDISGDVLISYSGWLNLVRDLNPHFKFLLNYMNTFWFRYWKITIL